MCKSVAKAALAVAILGGLSLAFADDPKPVPASPAAPVAPPNGFPVIREKKLWAGLDLRGKPAPKLEVEKWLSPEPDTKGKVVLIDFWATWCPPCRASIPELQNYQRLFREDLVVIGISDEKEAVVKKYVEAQKVSYAQAIDTQARTKGAVRVIGIPHVLVIDTAGVVRWQGFPTSEEDPLSEVVLRQIIDADKAQRAKAEPGKGGAPTHAE